MDGRNGIVWPAQIAPFDCAVVVLDEADDTRIRPAVDALIGQLEALGLEVLEDDRDGKPGVKFKDIDLLGIPLRLVVSKRTLDADEVEYKLRTSGVAQREKRGSVAALAAAMLKKSHTPT
jgi:prolyl-tRNA synthetase